MKGPSVYRVLAILTACGLATAASAQIWDNGAPSDYAIYYSQLDEAWPFHSQVADDFRLNDVHSFTNDIAITNITWAGGWVPEAPDEIAMFKLILYGDLGGFPTGAGTDDPTSTAQAIRTVAGADLDTHHLFTEVYSLSADLSEDPIIVDPTRTYWLAIQYVEPVYPIWGWDATDAEIQGRSAVQGFPMVDVPYWTAVEPDMSFSMDGYVISPEGDLTGDGLVDVLDLIALLSNWGPCPDPPADCPADLHKDGVVDVVDLLIVLSNWS